MISWFEDIKDFRCGKQTVLIKIGLPENLDKDGLPAVKML
jgi:hypothetical protein